MTVRVYAVGKEAVPPLELPDRFRQEIAYFMSAPGDVGAPVPALPAGEYWISLENANRWLEEGVFYIVSPLDSENKAEVELTEDQERWLEWMIANQVTHVKLTK